MTMADHSWIHATLTEVIVQVATDSLPVINYCTLNSKVFFVLDRSGALSSGKGLKKLGKFLQSQARDMTDEYEIDEIWNPQTSRLNDVILIACF